MGAFTVYRGGDFLVVLFAEGSYALMVWVHLPFIEGSTFSLFYLLTALTLVP